MKTLRTLLAIIFLSMSFNLYGSASLEVAKVTQNIILVGPDVKDQILAETVVERKKSKRGGEYEIIEVSSFYSEPSQSELKIWEKLDKNSRVYMLGHTGPSIGSIYLTGVQGDAEEVGGYLRNRLPRGRFSKGGQLLTISVMGCHSGAGKGDHFTSFSAELQKTLWADHDIVANVSGRMGYFYLDMKTKEHGKLTFTPVQSAGYKILSKIDSYTGLGIKDSLMDLNGYHQRPGSKILFFWLDPNTGTRVGMDAYVHKFLTLSKVFSEELKSEHVRFAKDLENLHAMVFYHFSEADRQYLILKKMYQIMEHVSEDAKISTELRKKAESLLARFDKSISVYSLVRKQSRLTVKHKKETVLHTKNSFIYQTISSLTRQIHGVQDPELKTSMTDDVEQLCEHLSYLMRYKAFYSQGLEQDVLFVKKIEKVLKAIANSDSVETVSKLTESSLSASPYAGYYNSFANTMSVSRRIGYGILSPLHCLRSTCSDYKMFRTQHEAITDLLGKILFVYEEHKKKPSEVQMGPENQNSVNELAVVKYTEPFWAQESGLVQISDNEQGGPVIEEIDGYNDHAFIVEEIDSDTDEPLYDNHAQQGGPVIEEIE